MKYLIAFILGLFGTIQIFSQEPLPKTSFIPVLFDYTAPVPTDGRMKCAVELWGSSCSYFIVKVDSLKNWKLIKAEYGGKLLSGDTVVVDKVKAILNSYIAEIQWLGVSPKDIHFIRSSNEKEANMFKIEAILQEMGIELNIIDNTLEAKSLLATVPAPFQSSSFVVNIGSFNTRILWLPDGKVVAPGSKYFLKDLNPNAVFEEVKDKSVQIPAKLRETCFILGGVTYEFAKQARKDSERYTVLKAPNNYIGEGNRQKAGLNIYDAIAKATGCRQFVFDWDANYAIGFLLTL